MATGLTLGARRPSTPPPPPVPPTMLSPQPAQTGTGARKPGGASPLAGSMVTVGGRGVGGSHGVSIGNNATIAKAKANSANPLGLPWLSGGVGADGSVPMGGGSTIGGAGGGGGTGSSTTAEVPPYLQQIMDMYKGLYSKAGDLYDKPLDFEAERANIRRDQSQKLNELRTAGGARGGLWTSDLSNIADSFGRELSGAEAGFTNRGLEAKRNILGDMSNVMAGLTGAGGTTARAQADALDAAYKSQALGLDAWKAQMQLPLEYYKAQQAGQMNQLSLIKALL